MSKSKKVEPNEDVKELGALQENEETNEVETQDETVENELPTGVGDVAALMRMMEDMQDKIDELSGSKTPKKVKKAKEYFATMREYAVEDEKTGELDVQGVVTRLYAVREVKDPTETRRYIGLCKLDVLNPKTGKTQTVNNVNYENFLQKATTVKCKILSWNKQYREEIDPRTGGGGTHPYIKVEKNPVTGVYYETASAEEIDFVNTYMDQTMNLEILAGEFEGCKLTNDGLGLNF